MRMRVRSLASLSALSTQWFCELWCKSQMRLGSHTAAAVVQACSCSCNSIPGLGTSMCQKKKKKKKKKKGKRKEKKKRKHNKWKVTSNTVDLNANISIITMFNSQRRSFQNMNRWHNWKYRMQNWQKSKEKFIPH